MSAFINLRSWPLKHAEQHIELPPRDIRQIAQLPLVFAERARLPHGQGLAERRRQSWRLLEGTYHPQSVVLILYAAQAIVLKRAGLRRQFLATPLSDKSFDRELPIFGPAARFPNTAKPLGQPLADRALLLIEFSLKRPPNVRTRTRLNSSRFGAEERRMVIIRDVVRSIIVDLANLGRRYEDNR